MSETLASRRCSACDAVIPAGVLTCPQCGADAPTESAPDAWVEGVAEVEELEVQRSTLAEALGAGFEVRRLVGRGGFGDVWEAYDLRLGRSVAVKVLRQELASSAAFRERFRREARAVARLRHPAIVPIYHVGEALGLVYFIMPLVDGVTLKGALEREGRLSTEETVRILSEASGALREAHRRGIVHRDLKPENFMLEGTERHVLLMDFGIAQSEEGGKELTGAGLVLGSPEYMSPEQATGERQLDGRSDIYSLGVVAYRMLAGRLPFEAETAREALAHHAITPPEPLSDVAVVPRGLSDAIMRCLAKRPDERFQTTEELIAALTVPPRPSVDVLAGPALPPLVAMPPALAATAELPRVARRRVAWVAIPATLVAASVAGWLWLRWADQRRWDRTAAAVETAYHQVTDSLRTLGVAFREGTIGASAYLAAQEALQQGTDARIAQAFGSVLDDLAAWPGALRPVIDSVLHASWEATLPGGDLAIQSAGNAGCLLRRGPETLVLEDSTAGDNCWWSVSAAPPTALPVEYSLTFDAPRGQGPGAGIGLAWCHAVAECRVLFVWSHGRIESAAYRSGTGLHLRRLGRRVPPLEGRHHLRVRVDSAGVRSWLDDALVLERPSSDEARLLAETGALRVIVQNSAFTLAGPSALQVVGTRR